MRKALSVVFALLLLALPFSASAQESQPGSLTIHKIQSALDTPGQPLEEVTFQLNRALPNGELGTPITAVVDKHRGAAHFPDLAAGTYLVQELPSRAGDVARAVAAPQQVSIPQEELFDVHLTPKPQTPTLIKSAASAVVSPGDIFSYTLEGNVPAPDRNGALHRYVIKDELPAGLSLSGNSALELRADSQRWPLQLNQDYTIDTVGNNAIRAAFTTQGLEVLAQKRTANPDLRVHFSFEVIAAEDLAGNTQLRNIAYFYPDGFPETTPDSVSSNEVALPVTDFPADFSPEATGTAPDPEKQNILASTGAAVIGIVIVGVLLVLAGIGVLLRNRMRGNND